MVRRDCYLCGAEYSIIYDFTKDLERCTSCENIWPIKKEGDEKEQWITLEDGRHICLNCEGFGEGKPKEENFVRIGEQVVPRQHRLDNGKFLEPTDIYADKNMPKERIEMTKQYLESQPAEMRSVVRAVVITDNEGREFEIGGSQFKEAAHFQLKEDSEGHLKPTIVLRGASKFDDVDFKQHLYHEFGHAIYEDYGSKGEWKGNYDVYRDNADKQGILAISRYADAYHRSNDPNLYTEGFAEMNRYYEIGKIDFGDSSRMITSTEKELFQTFKKIRERYG